MPTTRTSAYIANSLGVKTARSNGRWVNPKALCTGDASPKAIRGNGEPKKYAMTMANKQQDKTSSAMRWVPPT